MAVTLQRKTSCVEDLFFLVWGKHNFWCAHWKTDCIMEQVMWIAQSLWEIREQFLFCSWWLSEILFTNPNRNKPSGGQNCFLYVCIRGSLERQQPWYLLINWTTSTCFVWIMFIFDAVCWQVQARPEKPACQFDLWAYQTVTFYSPLQTYPSSSLIRGPWLWNLCSTSFSRRLPAPPTMG